MAFKAVRAVTIRLAAASRVCRFCGLLRRFVLFQAALDAFEEGEDGRAEQVKPDGDYRHPQPLGRAHEMCVARARKKAATRKAESMRALALPGGGHVDFSKDTRAAIDPKLIQRIR